MKKFNKYALYIFPIFILLLSLFIGLYKTKNVATKIKTPEYKHTGKCIACEKQFSENTRWVGLSNKCYDCEKDLIIRSGGDVSAAYNGVKSKCFDC